MEKVTEKEIAEKINDVWHINWYNVLLFALKRKIDYERMQKATYEYELNYVNTIIKHCQKQLKMTNDEVKKAYECLGGEKKYEKEN